jgi:hypothetical protein
MSMPQIMVVDRPNDSTDTVLNIDLQEDTLILHALEDVTFSMFGEGYPNGTLRMKAGMVIMFPAINPEDIEYLFQEEE